MDVQEVCAICEQAADKNTMESWNAAPTCEACYGAVTAVQFHNSKSNREDTLALLRVSKWIAAYEVIREAQEEKAHVAGVAYLRKLFNK